MPSAHKPPVTNFSARPAGESFARSRKKGIFFESPLIFMDNSDIMN